MQKQWPKYRNTSTRFSKAQLKCLLLSEMALAIFAAGLFLSACHHNINIVSRTVTTGAVNGAAFKGSIIATINVGRGGYSTCTFEQLPPHFTPGTIGTHAWTTHHTGAGLDPIGDVVTLYEMTGGNYRVHRTLSYPEFPNSQIVFDTEVTALRNAEWATKITISGNYDGPTDVVSVRDYHLEWSTDGKTLSEKGFATLVASSGRSFRSVWISSIVPDKPRFERFPTGGETVNVTFSPFKIEGDKMSYSWKGTVRAAVQQR